LLCLINPKGLTMRSNINHIVSLTAILLTITVTTQGNVIDGRSSLQFQPYNTVFTGTTANAIYGFVRLENGFSVVPNASTSASLIFDGCTPVAGAIDLRETGSLILASNLVLDGAVTLSSGGYICGEGNAIVLTDNLTIPANKTIHIASDTQIDGNGYTLRIDDNAQILVDTNVTLTLHNLTLTNKRHGLYVPPVLLASTGSALAFDHVTIKPQGDFVIPQGQIFIHNDVLFTGTNAFIYRSSQPCTIASNALLYFDPGTTFDFWPSTTGTYPAQAIDYVKLTDASSTLYLNGCSLTASQTGLRLTKGRLLFENSVALNSNGAPTINPATSTGGINDVFPGQIDGGPANQYDFASVALSPDGNYVAAAYDDYSLNIGYVRLFTFTQSSATGGLVEIATPLALGTWLSTVAWSPDGKYLATAGGVWGTGIIKVYRFDNATLTEVGTPGGMVQFSSSIYCLAWSPDGNYVVVGTSPNQIKVFQLTATGNGGLQEVGTPGGSQSMPNLVYSIAWSSDGASIIAGDGTGNVKLYTFTGTGNGGLTEVGTPGTTQSFGNYVAAVAWSPDGNYAAAFTLSTGGGQLKTYRPSPSGQGGLAEVGTPGTSYSAFAYPNTVAWCPDGRYLIVGGNYNGLKMCQFTGTGNGGLADVGSGTQPIEAEGNAVALSADSRYLIAALISYNPSYSAILKAYALDWIADPNQQALSTSIIFGKSSQGGPYDLDEGASYDLDVSVLAGARVNVTGNVVVDNV
jgi:WD40 repeat protein